MAEEASLEEVTALAGAVTREAMVSAEEASLEEVKATRTVYIQVAKVSQARQVYQEVTQEEAEEAVAHQEAPQEVAFQ